MPKWGKIAKSGHTVSNITDFLFQVGHTNPRVELWLADLSGGSIEKKQILAPFSLSNEEAHFSWVVWPNQDQFAVTWMNRVQVNLRCFCQWWSVSQQMISK